MTPTGESQATQDRWEMLNNIRTIASTLSASLGEILQLPTPTHSPSADLEAPCLVFPSHSHILSPLYSLQIPKPTLEAILASIARRIRELQELYVSSYHRSARECSSRFPSSSALGSLHRVYQDMSEKQYPAMIEKWVSFTMTAVADHLRSVSAQNRKPFNNDCVPMLDEYFKLNGYPSVAHRSILAEKSHMTPRQIEVWFQNHRNRAKKEGRIVQRLSSDAPLHKALPTLCKSSIYKHQSDPRSQEKFSIKKIEEKTTVVNRLPDECHALNNFDGSRPPHAFPAKMLSDYPDPFPTHNGIFKFPPPIWTRKPASSPIFSPEIDMDDFSRVFHLKLNFSECSRQRGPTPGRQEIPFSQPWFIGTTTFAPPAPHPAFIRISASSQPSAPPSHIQSAGTLSEPIFGSSSLSISDMGRPGPPVETRLRKVRPFPRRKPSQFQSTPFGPRTSFLNSDPCTGRRTSSSSSSNYSSSPEPSTPPSLLHAELPVVQSDAQQPDSFGFSFINLDDHSLSEIFPSQDFRLANLYSISDKFSDIPLFDNALPDFSHNLGDIFS